jgi:lipase
MGAAARRAPPGRGGRRQSWQDGRRRSRHPPIPAVFVHGLIRSLDDPDVLEHLSPRPVVAPDLLGYGEHAKVPPESIDLEAQLDYLGRVIDAAGADRVHLVGHSVGGVVAALAAERDARRIASLISVEGNFTPADAFWSAKVARMTAEQVEQMFADSRADPTGWLRDAGVAPDERRLALARRWLGHQPASSGQAMARAVVDATGRRTYEQTLRSVFGHTVVHLVAGERSRDG